MIRQTYAASLSGPAEYRYTKPVECFVCEETFDREDHEEMLFALDGVPDQRAVICEDCDINCAQCGESVLESLPMNIKQIQDGVLWIDDKPFHGDCVAVAVCQEAA